MAASDVWVLNASPVILLGKIGRLDVLDSLVAKAIVPDLSDQVLTEALRLIGE